MFPLSPARLLKSQSASRNVTYKTYTPPLGPWQFTTPSPTNPLFNPLHYPPLPPMTCSFVSEYNPASLIRLLSLPPPFKYFFMRMFGFPLPSPKSPHLSSGARRNIICSGPLPLCPSPLVRASSLLFLCASPLLKLKEGQDLLS